MELVSLKNEEHTKLKKLNQNEKNTNQQANRTRRKSVSHVDIANSNLKLFLYSLINNPNISGNENNKTVVNKKEAHPLKKVRNKTLFETFINSASNEEPKSIDDVDSKQSSAVFRESQETLMNNTETAMINTRNTIQSNENLIIPNISKKLPSKFKPIITQTNEDSSGENSFKNNNNPEDKDGDSDDSSIQNIIDLNKNTRKEFTSICDQFKSNIVFDGKNIHRFNDKLRLVESKLFFQNDTMDMEEINRKKADRLFRHIERKEHVFDSFSESEEDEMLNEFFIDPHSVFIFYFDMVIAFCGIYSFIFVPLELAFGIHENLGFTHWKNIMNCIVSLAFIIDFIMSFFMAYFTFEEEQLMTDVKNITINYLKSWFIADLLSGTPFILFLEWKFPTHNEYLFSHQFVVILQLLRILQIIKMVKIIFRNAFMYSIYSLCTENQHLNRWFRVYGSIIIYFFCNHFLCCVFIFLAKLDYPNWIQAKNMDYQNEQDVYVASLYFIFTTIYTIGYGDICSQNDYERVFNILLLIVGIMAYSYALSALSNFVMEEDNSTAQFHKKVAILEDISHSNKHITESLYRKIYLHLKYKLKSEQNSSNEIIGDLPFGLRNSLIYEMYKPIIENFIFFKSFNNIEFIIKVILALKPAIGSKNDKLVKEGDFIEEIYFVKRGNLVIEIPLPTTIQNKGNIKLFTSTTTQDFLKRKLTTTKSLIIPKETPQVQYLKLLEIRRNEHFGDVLMFSNKKSPLSMKVKSKIAELFLLKKTDAVEISMQFPNIWRTIIKKSLYNMEQIEKLLKKSIRDFLVRNVTNNEESQSIHNSTVKLNNDKKKNLIKTIVEEDSKLENSSNNRQISLSQINESNKFEENESMSYSSSKSHRLMSLKTKEIEIESNNSTRRVINSIDEENLSLSTKDLPYMEITEIFPSISANFCVNTLDNSNDMKDSNKKSDQQVNNIQNNDKDSKWNINLMETSFVQSQLNLDNFKCEQNGFSIRSSSAYYPTNHPCVFIKGSRLSIKDLDTITQQFISFQGKKELSHNISETNSNKQHLQRHSMKPFKSNINFQVNESDVLKDNDEGSSKDYLSKLSFNIQKSSENLNNPEFFYSEYFNSVLNNRKTNDVMVALDKKVDDFFRQIKTNTHLLKKKNSV